MPAPRTGTASPASTASETIPTAPPVPEIPGYRLVETLHASAPRVVYRAIRNADGRQVAVKTLAAARPRRPHVAELRREFQVTSRVQLPGVIRVERLFTWGNDCVGLELELFGRSLADWLATGAGQTMAIDRFLRVAIELARILGRVHEAGVVHKDVVPRNVLYDEQSDGLRLIDFGIASELDRERQSVEIFRGLVGSLPYISPEQTGRMNRDLDYRTDYYSLGATLYELLTGELPFRATTPLEWVHQHISKQPQPPRARNPQIPEPLSEIVLKLMSKNAEDRYQSSYGLIADLERVQRDLASGRAAPFPLGTRDVSPRFQIPQRIFGRQDELKELGARFDGVAHGAVEFCLVSGWSGVGKSRLVGELSRSIVRERGWLVEGKFDQFQQSTAYVALAQAIRSLARQLLTSSQAELQEWKREIVEALGPNLALVVDLAEELELIVGPQPPVPSLPPTEAQNRFQIAFVDFLKVFADPKHPLVIFLDDLQWSDGPTLDLLQRLVVTRDLGGLMLIGAYRTNEVHPGHPLRIALEGMRQRREILDLELSPLSATAVRELVADALHCPPAASAELADLVYDRAQGNPFFVTELLRGLEQQGAIGFATESGRWTWDLAKARSASVADSVVGFLVQSLRRLPEDTQHVLQLAACIGNTFDLRTLATVHSASLESTSAQLREALLRNLVVPLTDSYRIVGHDAGADESVHARYRFQHDRVQQAAHELIDADRRAALHQSIGTLLLENTTPEALPGRLMTIVGHLNEGRALLRDPDRIRELADLNLQAGTRARNASAYGAALGYLTIGLELLGDAPWTRDPDLAMALSRGYQQCAYLAGRQAEAEAWSEPLLAHARTDIERAEILSDLTRQYATLGKPGASIRAAIEGLNLLGVSFSSDPDDADIQAELEAVDRHLAGRSIEALVHAPQAADPVQLSAIRLLMEIFPAAFLSGSGKLFPYLVIKAVGLSLAHGNSPESAFAYAAYGMLLCGSLDDRTLGYRYGRAAVQVNELFEDTALKSRVIYVYAMFVHHWSNHWKTMTPWFLKGIESGYRSGDLLYLAYSAQDCIIWDPTLDLETAAAEQRRYLEIVNDTGYRDSYDSGSLFLQMQLCFLGLTEGALSMNDDAFDEAAVVAGMRARGFMTGIANHHIYKAEIAWLHEKPQAALVHVEAMGALIGSAMSLPQLVRFTIVAFLVRAALFGDQPEVLQGPWRVQLEADRAQMQRWAEDCEANFRHLDLLMGAELTRLDGRLVEALDLYEQAIVAARASEFRRDEAMANEQAGRCLDAAGLSRAAEGYYRAAHYLYYRWGAHRKVRLLEARHSELRFEVEAPKDRANSTIPRHTGTSDSMDDGALDLASVMKASQAISGELVLAQLWKTTLHLLVENVGAQRGVFVVRSGGQLVIQARFPAGEEPLGPEQPVPEGPNAEVPLSIVHAVLHTREPLVLEDASHSERFAGDPYIAQARPRSVLCVPLVRHGEFEGVIYLENNLTTGAFTEDRIKVIQLLSAQAAISTENAQLYEDQARLIEAQRRFVPSQFLENLGHRDIARVRLGQVVSRVMTVMFSDLREFTPLAERLGPHGVIAILNRYFASLEDPIARSGGFIDSFNGDEIMALFGVSADRAVQAGIGMWEALDAFNERAARDGEPQLKMGIGMNTGALVLGTVGGRDRLKCGVVGDTVNLASRIEQVTKRYDCRFLIGEQTYEALEDRSALSLRLVDRVAVKGKTRAVRLFEVLDACPAATRDLRLETGACIEAAWPLYETRHFAEALVHLDRALGLDPDDTVLQILAQRIRAYRDDPPPPDWQGFETLSHK